MRSTAGGIRSGPFSTPLAETLDEGEMLENNCCYAELCLAKVAPRFGRNARSALDLQDSLYVLASTFISEGLLEERDSKAFAGIQLALTSCLDSDLETTRDVLEALEALDSIDVDREYSGLKQRAPYSHDSQDPAAAVFPAIASSRFCEAGVGGRQRGFSQQ